MTGGDRARDAALIDVMHDAGLSEWLRDPHTQAAFLRAARAVAAAAVPDRASVGAEEHSDATVAPTEGAGELDVTAIRAAISDPIQYAGVRLRSQDESLAEWQARAVVAVLAPFLAERDALRDTVRRRDEAVRHLLAMIEGRAWRMTREDVEIRCSSPVGPDEPCGECIPCWTHNVEKATTSVRAALVPPSPGEPE